MPVNIIGMRRPRRMGSAYPPDVPGESFKDIATKRRDLLRDPNFNPIPKETPDDEEAPPVPPSAQPPLDHDNAVRALQEIIKYHSNEAQKAQDQGAIKDKVDQKKELEGE
jgi:hypothetical protein